MSEISTPVIPASVFNQKLSGKQNQIATAGFDDLLAGNTSNYDLGSSFLDSITQSVNDNFADGNSSYSTMFPFSTDFQSAFGTSGPLLNFINQITAQLHLTAAQNQAFQQIAVNNKDATKSPDSVNKIAAELKQAGIAYS